MRDIGVITDLGHGFVMGQWKVEVSGPALFPRHLKRTVAVAIAANNRVLYGTGRANAVRILS